MSLLKMAFFFAAVAVIFCDEDWRPNMSFMLASAVFAMGSLFV